MREKPKQPWWTKQIDLLTALAGLFIITMFVMNQPLTLTETQLFKWFYHWPASWRPVILTITQLGSAWALIGLTITIAWLKKSWPLAIKFFSVGVLVYSSTIILKHIVARARPYQILGDVVQRDRVGTADYGFPSAHASMAIAAALLLLPLIPRTWRWLLIILVGLVGVSRLYLGVHFPLDIVGGYCLGWLVVSVVEYQQKLLAKQSPKA